MKNIVENFNKNQRPEKILQFGAGNFLRAFADYAVDIMNKKGLFHGSVVICQSTSRGSGDIINAQNGLYTVVLRGRENGKIVDKSEVVESVSRCVNANDEFSSLLDLAKSDDLKLVISNTTEAGIVFNSGDKFSDNPPSTYPGKLTRILYERYKYFNADKEKALLILPCELIDKNGDELLNCVLKYCDSWNLGEDFKNWLSYCDFSNTLVDRIVTGKPSEDLSEKLGYDDKLIDVAEPFFFWAIEGSEKLKDAFPLDKSGLNVVFSDDISLYKKRKVRILNGAHTVSVLGAYLEGFDIVRDMMQNEKYNSFIKDVLLNEVMPYIELPQKEKEDFANAVLERFDNPFIDHKLLDISLNSVSKFKARCLPSLIDNVKDGKFPKGLFTGLAYLIKFYNGEWIDGKLYGERSGEKYEIRDDKKVLGFFNEAYKSGDVVKAVLSNKELWDEDLTEIQGAVDFVKNILIEE